MRSTATAPKVPKAKALIGEYYAAGPAITLGTVPERTSTPPLTSARDPQRAGQRESGPSAQGKGEPAHDTANAKERKVRLRGRTDAAFDGGSFRTENVSVERGEGCAGCAARDCIRARGHLVATYVVTTTVTLPSVNDFAGLTPCQRRRVQDAIDNVLRPHEEAHVRAFQTYNGATRRPFDFTLCRSEFDAAIRSMFEDEEQGRRAAAQNASDALDPFYFDVDLACEEGSGGVGSGAGSSNPAGIPEPGSGASDASALPALDVG